MSLREVHKRRVQLWSVSMIVIVAVTVAVALASISKIGPFGSGGVETSWVSLALVSGLALAFLIYVTEKERALRRLTDLLVEERVRSAALSNRLAEISALSEVGKAVNATLDLDDVLRLILSSAIELLGGTEGSIMLLAQDARELQVVSCQGPRFELVINRRVAVGYGIAGRVALTRRPMLIQGDAGSGRDIPSAMCVPLIRRDELLGVLNLNETAGERSFSDYDLRALEVFAEHAAVAIGNARLYEQERRTVERLEELDRLKSDFVATVSHELKTPLTAIIGAAGTLTRRAERLAPDQKADFLAMIERQGNRLLRLVEDVLVTARIESGSSRMHREPVDLRTLAEGVVADLSGTPSALGREVRIRCRPERPTVWANRGALHQVTLNLVENALKYSEPGTPVALTVTEDAEESTISVGDRGRGIAREELDAIFQRFRQVGTASTRSVEGFGLGLFIVESLVAAHNGRVEVVSERGVGSTFTVHLPNG